MADQPKAPTNAKAGEMVTIPAADLQKLIARIDALEHTAALSAEITDRRAKVILDQAFEEWKKEVARPAAERTQDIADAKYGKDGKRFRCYLDSTKEDGKPGPKIGEHPVLVLSANSPEEAQGRYLQVTGIRKHDHRLIVEPVNAA